MSFWTTAPRDGFTALASRQVFTTPKGKKPKPEREFAPEPTAEPKVCALKGCGAMFTPKLRGPAKLYCSQLCNARAWKLRRRTAA